MNGTYVLHENRIIHRDFKLENILVKFKEGITIEEAINNVDCWQLKIADFGISK